MFSPSFPHLIPVAPSRREPRVFEAPHGGASRSIKDQGERVIDPGIGVDPVTDHHGATSPEVINVAGDSGDPTNFG